MGKFDEKEMLHLRISSLLDKRNFLIKEGFNSTTPEWKDVNNKLFIARRKWYFYLNKLKSEINKVLISSKEQNKSFEEINETINLLTLKKQEHETNNKYNSDTI